MTDVPIYNPMLADAPFDDYAKMRENSGCPVAHSGPLDYPFYVFTNHADVRAALTSPAEWTARYGTSPLFQKQIGFFAEGKDHSDFRRIFSRRLTPDRLAALEPIITSIASELLDAMIAKGPEVDFHDDFALPLPIRIVALLLGIPGDDFPALKHLSNELIDNAFGRDNDAFLRTFETCNAFFERYLIEREAMLKAAGVDVPAPEHVGTILPDDWISDAICQPFQGRNLTRAEQHIALMGLLVGGNETTTSLMTNLLWRLIEVPARWAQLKANPALIPNALEESLRFDSPAIGMFRTSLCPMTVAGTDIPEKSKLMMAFGAANHDPSVFEAPEEFRLDRPRNELMKHLAFGLGAHACMGAPLARLEARIAFKQIIERMPDVALNGETVRNIGWNFWGRMKLPIRIG